MPRCSSWKSLRRVDEDKEVAHDKLGGARQKTAEKASEFEDQIVDYIRQKPLKSVLVAAGAGLLLGFLLSRR